jgi:C-terminal processing protease CtpA/Prc
VRFLLSLACIAFVASVPAADRVLTHEDFVQDFDYALSEVATTYSYFADKATAWGELRRLYADDLRKVESRREFVDLLEHVLDELYDAHAQLNTNSPASYRLVPSGTDLWAEWRNGLAIITQVRRGTDADRAGIRPNSVVVAINDQDITSAVDARLGRSYPHKVAAARDWALRSVLAGRHNAKRNLRLQVGGEQRIYELPSADQFGSGSSELVTHSELRPGIGYIRLNDSLGNEASIGAFDRALNELRETRALIIDLRQTASGGNSTVARGILGRFVGREVPYQKHVLTAEERETGVRRSWLELVSPRGEFIYRKPVAVLVDHWTGSMGEGIAIGFDAIGCCKVVGVPMAGLLGATYAIELPKTGIRINVPAERLYHVNGTAREAFRPGVAVNLAAAGGIDDPFIAAALRALTK